LKPLRNLVNQPNKHAFNKYVAEKLLKSLSTSSVQSNALNIVAKSLEEIYKDKTGKASIPYSSRQLFSKIASDFISGLNNDSLR
jgi:ribosomal protein S7